MLKLCFALTAVKQSWHSLTLACCALLDPALARNFTDTLGTETDACVTPRHVSRASRGVWCQAPGTASWRRAAFDCCVRRVDEGVARSSSSRGGLWHPELRRAVLHERRQRGVARRAEGSARRRDPRKADIDANGRSHRRCARLDARRRARASERARRDRGLRRGVEEVQGPRGTRSAPRERVLRATRRP